jgi:hypothetical protein
LSDAQFEVSQEEVEQEVTMVQGYISRWEELASEIRDRRRVDVGTQYETFAKEVEEAWAAFAEAFRRLYTPQVSSTNP